MVRPIWPFACTPSLQTAIAARKGRSQSVKSVSERRLASKQQHTIPILLVPAGQLRHASIAKKKCKHAQHAQLNLMQAFLVDSGDHTALSTVRSVEFVGNRTECSLLLMLRGWGYDYKGIRDSHREAVQKVYTFSSATKMASTLVQIDEDSYRLYVKVRNDKLPLCELMSDMTRPSAGFGFCCAFLIVLQGLETCLS